MQDGRQQSVYARTRHSMHCTRETGQAARRRREKGKRGARKALAEEDVGRGQMPVGLRMLALVLAATLLRPISACQTLTPAIFPHTHMTPHLEARSPFWARGFRVMHSSRVRISTSRLGSQWERLFPREDKRGQAIFLLALFCWSSIALASSVPASPSSTSSAQPY